MSDSLSGVWSAAVTPLHDDLTVDYTAMVAHYKWLLANGCDGVAVLGQRGLVPGNQFLLGLRIDGLSEREEVVGVFA